MMESGLDVRSQRRSNMYKFSHQIDQEQSRLIQISFDFIEKLLIWILHFFCLLANFIE